ncbi:MAG: carboxypeptidase regulatory-like domain-containing protein [Acidobacteria bacterium]|nr:carboxypeptidase regulatory-like domain-containing protein [Acidobacteriota bacterium]
MSLVAGRVVDSVTRAPVRAAVVALYLDGNSALPTKVLTLADGRFLFRSVPKGTYRLYADKPGYLPGSSGCRATKSTTHLSWNRCGARLNRFR